MKIGYSQNNGSAEHAFGALILMNFATVGAMRSTVIGKAILSALVPAPYIMTGNCMKDALERVFSMLFSLTNLQPGATSMRISPFLSW